MEETTTFEAPKKRPGFLTVLCILSFIYGIFVIGSGTMQYFTINSKYDIQMEAFQKQMDMLSDNGTDSGFIYNSLQANMITLEKTYQNPELVIGTTLLFAILSLLGALLMFKLKKNGFYTYTFANLFALLVPLALIDFDAMLNSVLLASVVTIAFIIMYAVNLKHMK